MVPKIHVLAAGHQQQHNSTNNPGKTHCSIELVLYCICYGAGEPCFGCRRKTALPAQQLKHSRHTTDLQHTLTGIKHAIGSTAGATAVAAAQLELACLLLPLR
jgi:hypothetical protein